MCTGEVCGQVCVIGCHGYCIIILRPQKLFSIFVYSYSAFYLFFSVKTEPKDVRTVFPQINAALRMVAALE